MAKEEKPDLNSLYLIGTKSDLLETRYDFSLLSRELYPIIRVVKKRKNLVLNFLRFQLNLEAMFHHSFNR